MFTDPKMRSTAKEDPFSHVFVHACVHQYIRVSPPRYPVVCMCLAPWRGGGGGVTHIFRYTGMWCSNGSLFHKKSLNMGPIFYKNIPKHGWVCFFQNFQRVLGLSSNTPIQTKSEYPPPPPVYLMLFYINSLWLRISCQCGTNVYQ